MRFLLTSVLFLVVGCSSFDPIVYSEKHLDFKRANRTSEACTARGNKIAIASGGPRSTECGMEIHGKGGNIVDIATAVAFCLSVEHPQSAGLGGGGFTTLHLARDSEKDYFINFRETAPLGSKAKMFLDRTGAVIPGLSENGALSIATPGFVAGWYDTHQKWGKLKWKDLLIPAIRLANEGFPVYPGLAEKIQKRRELLLKDPYLARLLLPDGNALAIDSILKQPALGNTLSEIAENGKRAFYEGDMARDIARAVERNGGILSVADLRNYRVLFTKPLTGKFHGIDLITAPPPSAGGGLVLETLGILEAFQLNPSLPYSQYLHLISEAMKRAFADRAEFSGDAGFLKSGRYLDFLTPQHIEKQIRSLNPLRATEVESPSHQTSPESPDTTQLSIIDADGNALSSTLSINYYFGSAVSVPKWGIILNDEMDDFATKPGASNLTGLIGSKLNEIAPGKRPASSMTPTIALRNGKPVLALGAPGSSYIVSGILSTLLNYALIYAGDLQKSVFAPRAHHQWKPNKILMEIEGFPGSTLSRLKEKGHELGLPQFRSLVEAVSRNEMSGELLAVSDPRDVGGAAAR